MDLDHVHQGDNVPIAIHYFRGWDFRHAHRQRIPQRLDLPDAVCSGSLPDGGRVVMLPRDNNFSWGSGPSSATNYVVLYPQGKLGVRAWDGSVYRWPHEATAAPTWKWIRNEDAGEP